MQGAIQVLVIDDHPALREGLQGLLRQADGFLPVGALAGASELVDAIGRLRPDVVILDYALENDDGLSVCFRIKQRPDPPGVVLYSAYVDGTFAVPATLAQADGIISKTAPVEDLLGAVRRVAAGERLIPPLHPDAMGAASARLSPPDMSVAGMLFSRVTIEEIADTLSLSTADVRARALRIIGKLQARDRIGVDPPTESVSFSLG